MDPVKALENHGQAVWLDFLARGFVAKGDLKKLIRGRRRQGRRFQPVDLREAIGSSDEYDGAIGQALRKGDRPVADLFEHLAIEDIQHAAGDAAPGLRPVERRTQFVSLEVSPYLAMDTKGTIASRTARKDQAQEFDGEGAGNTGGLPAIQQLIGRHQHQHHAIVLAKGLSPGGGGLSQGPRKIRRQGGDPSSCRERRQLLRQPDQQCRRQAAR